MFVLGLLMKALGCDTGGGPGMAWQTCKDHVEMRLKDPASADFPIYPAEGDLEELDDDVFLIRAYVDAANSFGGTVRNSFVCRVKYLGDNEWSLLKLKLK